MFLSPVVQLFPVILVDQLREELNQARDGRQNLEIKREELVRRAKILQQKTQGRRNQGQAFDRKEINLDFKNCVKHI